LHLTMKFITRSSLVFALSLVVFGQQRPNRSNTGASIGENKATPIERIKVAKDFKVELLYSVPNDRQGSWVNLCLDNKGRIITSDQYGGLYAFTPPPLDRKSVV